MTVPAKEPPEAVAIRAKPRPVTRLSRKGIVGLLGVSATVIMGGTLWALRPMERRSSPDELYSTEHHAVAEGVSRLPRDYSSVASATSAPKLGPPLPGDLGLPIVRAQAGGRMAAGAAPAMRSVSSDTTTVADHTDGLRQKTVQDAVGSPLFSISDRGRGSAATDQMAADGASSLVRPTSVESTGTAALTPSRHEAFANTVADQPSASAHRLEAPASPYSVLAGTMISAALVTGLNSDLPGQAIAVVTSPVYDTVTGRTLLIPQGARLLGTYDSQTAFGERRAFAVWTRLILPNGRSVILDRLSGVDAQGFAGLADRVDQHWGRLIGGAAVSSLLGVGAELAAPQTSGGDGQIVIATRDGVQDTVNQVGQELTRRNLDIKPTIRVRPGFPIRVLVSRDLVLDPYAGLGG